MAGRRGKGRDQQTQFGLNRYLRRRAESLSLPIDVVQRLFVFEQVLRRVNDLSDEPLALVRSPLAPMRTPGEVTSDAFALHIARDCDPEDLAILLNDALSHWSDKPNPHVEIVQGRTKLRNSRGSDPTVVDVSVSVHIGDKAPTELRVAVTSGARALTAPAVALPGLFRSNKLDGLEGISCAPLFGFGAADVLAQVLSPALSRRALDTKDLAQLELAITNDRFLAGLTTGNLRTALVAASGMPEPTVLREVTRALQRNRGVDVTRFPALHQLTQTIPGSDPTTQLNRTQWDERSAVTTVTPNRSATCVWMFAATQVGAAGGVNTHIRNMTDLLTQQGFRVIVIAGAIQPSISFDTSMGPETVGLPSLSYGFVRSSHGQLPPGSVDDRYQSQLLAELATVADTLQPPDIVHAHDLAQSPRSIASAVMNFSDGPKLLTTHSMYEQRVDPEIWSMGWANLAVSSSIARAVRAHASCRVVSPGFRLHPSTGSVPAVVRTGGPVLLNLGRIAPDKNTRSLVRAFSRLPVTHDSNLVLCDPRKPGRTPDSYQAALFDMVLALPAPVRRRVHFLPIGHHNVAAYLDRVRASGGAVVLPSVREGLPVAALESLAAGTAVVASDIDGFSDVITDRNNGLLVAPDDRDAMTRAITEVLADDSLRHGLEANGPGSVQDHRAEAVGELLAHAYNQLTRDASRARSELYLYLQS